MVCPVIGSGSGTPEAKHVRSLLLLTKLTEALGHRTWDRQFVRLEAGALSIVDKAMTDGKPGEM